jgi:hypothetical protein
MTGISGPRRLRVLNAPRGWALKAVRVNGRDVDDTPLVFGTNDQSIGDLEVVLTNRAGGIAGTVADGAGRPVARYVIVLFPAETERRYWQSPYLRFSGPMHDGSFTLLNLPDGDYCLAAIDWIQGTADFGEWQDPDFLESLSARALRVTVREGERRVVTARLIVR